MTLWSANFEGTEMDYSTLRPITLHASDAGLRNWALLQSTLYMRLLRPVSAVLPFWALATDLCHVSWILAQGLVILTSGGVTRMFRRVPWKTPIEHIYRQVSGCMMPPSIRVILLRKPIATHNSKRNQLEVTERFRAHSGLVPERTLAILGINGLMLRCAEDLISTMLPRMSKGTFSAKPANCSLRASCQESKR